MSLKRSPLLKALHSSSPLRVDLLHPGLTEAPAGGDVAWRRLRRGAGCRLGSSCKRIPGLLPWYDAMPVGWRRATDLFGWIRIQVELLLLLL
jgi:hypothetical protein